MVNGVGFHEETSQDGFVQLMLLASQWVAGQGGAVIDMAAPRRATDFAAVVVALSSERLARFADDLNARYSAAGQFLFIDGSLGRESETC